MPTFQLFYTILWVLFCGVFFPFCGRGSCLLSHFKLDNSDAVIFILLRIHFFIFFCLCRFEITQQFFWEGVKLRILGPALLGCYWVQIPRWSTRDAFRSARVWQYVTNLKLEFERHLYTGKANQKSNQTPPTRDNRHTGNCGDKVSM